MVCIMEKKEWILLVAGCVEEGGLTPVQLQKSLFLIKEMLPDRFEDEEFYDFSPYNFGPFSKEIYQDAESLALEGYIAINRLPDKRLEEYSITAKGLKLASQFKENFEPQVYDYISKVVHWVRSATFTHLLKTIYNKFPKYRVNSVFKG